MRRTLKVPVGKYRLTKLNATMATVSDPLFYAPQCHFIPNR